MKRWTLRIILCLIFGAVTTVAVAWAAWRFDRPRILYPGSFNPTTGQWTPDVSALSFFDAKSTVALGTKPPSILVNNLAKTTRAIDASVFHLEADVAFIFGAPLSDWVWTVFGELRSENEVTAEYLTRSKRVNLLLFRSGWPLRAIHRKSIDVVSPLSWGSPDAHGELMVALLYGLNSDTAGRLDGVRSQYRALRVIWSGFVIDTLFYAAIWGGVFFGFASAKRAVRRKRGRCPRCGYDLRGHRHEGTPAEPRRHEGLEAGCPECGWGRNE